VVYCNDMKTENAKNAKNAEDTKKPWVKTIRRESGLIEHICEHGVGHPAYASVHWMEINGHHKMGVHGCDGCCTKPEWIVADLTEGIQKANEIIKNLIKKSRIEAPKKTIRESLREGIMLLINSHERSKDKKNKRRK
jgi:hypothetical protein